MKKLLAIGLLAALGAFAFGSSSAKAQQSLRWQCTPTSSCFVNATTPLPVTGTGGGGSAVTAALGSFVDGALVTMGAKADAAWDLSSPATEISILKSIAVNVASPIPTGTNVIGHIICDSGCSGSGTVQLLAGTAAIGSLTAGSAVIGHVINDASSAVIGHVIADTGSTTAVTALPAIPTGSNVIGALTANQSVNTAQINGVTTLTGTGAVGTGSQRVAVGTDTATIAGSAPGTAGSASANVLSIQGVASMTPVQVTPAGPYPNTAVPITASTTGTTAATTATLTNVSGHTTYICGFSIRANATAAVTGNATVTGTISGTLNFTQWTAPSSSGLGINEQVFTPCVPASAVSTSIAVISAAPGTGGVVSVTAWGYSI